MQNSHPLGYLWPSIEDRETARSACALGMLAAFAAALWSAGFGVFAWANNGHVGSFRVPLVPLLAVPQLTHYVLDGFIWRRRGNEGVFLGV